MASDLQRPEASLDDSQKTSRDNVAVAKARAALRKPAFLALLTGIVASAAPIASALFAHEQGLHQQQLEREKDERSILRDYLGMVAGGDRGKNDIPKVLRYIKETSQESSVQKWAIDELDRANNEIQALTAERQKETEKADSLTNQIAKALDDAGATPVPPNSTVVKMRSDLLQAQQKAAVVTRKLEGPVAAAAPLAFSSDDVTPRATSIHTDRKTPDGKPLFDFSVWLEMPPLTASAVREVTYTFRHPSFSAPLYSNDAASGFRIRYFGWGCVESVDATLTLKEGSRLTKSFNQCAIE
jgi:Uri superfamily endonuclease